MAIPTGMREKYDAIAPLISRFCADHLDEEYDSICLRLLEKLCRKRPSPLLSGREKTWAAGIVYEIASLNFIFDKSNPHHMSAEAIASGFGVAVSTAGNKAAEIRKLAKLSRMDAEWMTSAFIDQNPMVWMISVNGYLVDARKMPRSVQEIAFEKKLIPYIPDESNEDVGFISAIRPDD